MNRSAPRLASLAMLLAAASVTAQPANDDCINAMAVGNGSFAFTTAGATHDFTGACADQNTNGDVWFDYTAPTTGFAKVRPGSDAPADIGITVLDGSCAGSILVCDADFLFVGDTRQVVFPTVAGNHYLVRLQGVSNADATGHIEFSTALPPVNDECATATQISGAATFAYDNTLADNSGPDDGAACDGIGGMAIAHDVWFRWTNTLPAGQDAVVSLCGGTRVDTKLAVYADGCPPGAPLDCNDDFCFLQSQVRFTPISGASYLIRLGNWPGFNGNDGPDGKPGTFTVSAQPTCSLSAPPGALIEPEPCGQSVNDGYDDTCTAGGFTDIPCGSTTIFGTAPVLSDIPDQDMYRFTLTQAGHIFVSGTAEFPMLLGIFGTDCPATFYFRWRFPSGICEDPTLNPIDLDLDPGTYAIGVVNTRASSPCGSRNNYILSVTVTGCCRADFDHNGAVQPVDVAAFVNAWFSSIQNGSLAGDFDGNGQITPADVAAFVNAWFNALSTGSC